MNLYYICPSQIPEEYITSELVKKTKYKSVVEAYQRNLFSVIKRGGVFYIEGYGCSDRTYNLIVKETKRIYPELIYLHDAYRPFS